MDNDWIPAGRTRKGEKKRRKKNKDWVENVNERSSEEERKTRGGGHQGLSYLLTWNTGTDL